MNLHNVMHAQDLLHYMVSAHVRVGARDSIEEAARQAARLAGKHARWWEAHKRDAVPTTLYWNDDGS